jgi:Flp pilus assembly protein CpaB
LQLQTTVVTIILVEKGGVLLKRVVFFSILIATAIIVVYMFLPNTSDAEYFKVLKAKDDIPPGTVLSEEHLMFEDVHKIEDWMVVDKADVLGKISNQKIHKDRFIDVNMLSDNTVAIYKDGQGEYTIRTQTEYINGGRINIGDKVDVIMTKRSNSEGASYGEILVEDVTVVSIRTREGNSIEEERKLGNKRVEPYAVTLKTTVDQAASLAWGQEYGVLSLWLNKAGDNSNE